MKTTARACALLAILAIGLSACNTPAPTPTPTTSVVPTVTPTVTPTVVPTVPPTPTPTPTPTGQIPWGFVQAVVKPTGDFDFSILYLGFAGHPASVGLRYDNKTVSYQLQGDLAFIFAKLSSGKISATVRRISDGSSIWDISKLPSSPAPRHDFVFDGRGDKWVFYEASPTLNAQGADQGGFEYHRYNLTTGQDDILLAFGRPYGEPWADQDHAHFAVADLDRPGVMHYVVCANGLDQAACSFYLAGPRDATAQKQVSVTGNQTALCRIIGADDHYAFTVETTRSCGTGFAENATVRLTDLSSGESSAILVVDKRTLSLNRPQMVATAGGPRLIYTAIPKGSKNRVLDAFDPATHSAALIPFTIDRGSSISPAQYLILMPPIISASVDGRILVAPADVKTLAPVGPIFWQASITPSPTIVDVLSGNGVVTQVWDVPADLVPIQP